MKADWHDAQSFRTKLGEDGWVTPDTYCNLFSPLRDRPAVYLFLLYRPLPEFRNVIVAYVGMSMRVKTRMAGHDVLAKIDAPGSWVMRWFKPTPEAELRETEGRYIRQFSPPWNIAGKTRGVAIE